MDQSPKIWLGISLFFFSISCFDLQRTVPAAMVIPGKMKAAVLMAPNLLEVREVETPKPGPAEVLIRVASCAICDSDLSLMAHPWPGQPPMANSSPAMNTPG